MTGDDERRPRTGTPVPHWLVRGLGLAGTAYGLWLMATALGWMDGLDLLGWALWVFGPLMVVVGVTWLFVLPGRLRWDLGALHRRR